MSDSRTHDTGIAAHQPPELLLEMLALAEWLAEQRAAGNFPRLSELIATSPGDLSALADAVMVEAGEHARESGEPDNAEGPEVAEPSTLSPGTLRAVASIFGGGVIPAPETYQAWRDQEEPLARVAEAGIGYGAVADEVVRLLGLAHMQGLDAETLARLVMLSPEVVRWLDRVALPLNSQPDALVAHLVGALRIDRAHIQHALAQGEPIAEPADLTGMFTSDASLTAAQREYWLPLVSFSA